MANVVIEASLNNPKSLYRQTQLKFPIQAQTQLTVTYLQQQQQQQQPITIIKNYNKKCSHCGEKTTSKQKRIRKCDGVTTINYIWHRDGLGGWLCSKCHGLRFYRKRMLAGELGDDMEVMILPLNTLRKKLPTQWKIRDQIDLIGHVLDLILSKQNDNAIISMRTIRVTVGLKYNTFRRMISAMILSNLIKVVESHRKRDRTILRITPEGTRFVRIYRRILGLLTAWLN